MWGVCLVKTLRSVTACFLGRLHSPFFQKGLAAYLRLGGVFAGHGVTLADGLIGGQRLALEMCRFGKVTSCQHRGQLYLLQHPR